jgi:uncharacterized protein (TIRG00374 family)
MSTMNLSSRGWFALSIFFSLTVILIIFATTFNQDTVGYVLSFNYFFLGLAILFRIIALALWGLRIQLMSAAVGYRVHFFYCVNMVLAGLLAGTITPGQAGGEPVRVHELYCAGVKIGDATAIVIMERVLDGIILTATGVVLMVLMTGFVLSILSPALLILVICAWVFMISFLLIPILAVWYPEKTKKIIMNLVRRLAPHAGRFFTSPQLLTDRIDHEIDNVFTSMTRFTGPAWRGLFFGGIVTALFWISEFLVASVIMMGLGLEPFIPESFFFQIIIAIIMMIPLTPGSSGITELSTSSLYALIIPSGMIGIFVILWRFVTFYLNIILGTFAGIAIFRRKFRQQEEAGATDETG